MEREVLMANPLISYLSTINDENRSGGGGGGGGGGGEGLKDSTVREQRTFLNKRRRQRL